jgi:protein SCO1
MMWFPSSFLRRDCVAIPFMVREPHHERYCLVANSSTYPFALSLSKGSERIATQPRKHVLSKVGGREGNPEPPLNLPLAKGEKKRGLFAARSWNYMLLAIHFSLLFLQAWPLFAHDNRPVALRAVDLEQKLGAQIPLDIEFRDEMGRTVALKQYFVRRPVILLFVYYSCEDLCPLVLDGLVRSLRPLSFNIGDQFDVLTVSFDARDTPALAAAKKRDFVKQYSRPGTEKGWHFLTGDEVAIKRLTEAAGFRFNYESEKDRFGHATGIILLTPGGTITRYFYGMEFSPRDLRLGLIEASAGRIASPVDQLLLFCYRYDPATGKYGLLITNIVRLAGVATVIALVTLIAVMLRRDRSRKWQPEESV